MIQQVNTRYLNPIHIYRINRDRSGTSRKRHFRTQIHARRPPSSFLFSLLSHFHVTFPGVPYWISFHVYSGCFANFISTFYLISFSSFFVKQKQSGRTEKCVHSWIRMTFQGNPQTGKTIEFLEMSSEFRSEMSPLNSGWNFKLQNF